MSEIVVGGQGEVNSFHYQAAEQYFGGREGIRYVPFPDHEALLRGYSDPNHYLDRAMVAVDNNTSGRVISAIEAIRNYPNIHVIGSMTMKVVQRLIYYPGKDNEIQAVLSQQPALDQCELNIIKNGYVPIAFNDTAGAVARLSASKGHYLDFDNVAGIGPAEATKGTDLIAGPVFSHNPDNATKFWVLADDTDPEPGSHSAITFEVTDEPAQLYLATKIISEEHGFNMTDLDTHIAPSSSTRRGFFAEITTEDTMLSSRPLLKDLTKYDFNPTLLGTYTPKGIDLDITNTSRHVPSALQHDVWNGRHGLDHPPGSTTLYVETDHQRGALCKVLGNLVTLNLVDLGRPIVPKDHKFNRGFYIVIDPVSSEKALETALESIREFDGFSAEIIIPESEAA